MDMFGEVKPVITPGDRRVIGQAGAREHISKILDSDRVSHAYLFTGPPGVGKKALALAMAEMINGVDNLTDLKGTATSQKSSWYTHPDIRMFLPIPRTVSLDEVIVRTELLAKDPYEVVDFGLRPSTTDAEASKNRNAFYAIDYFRSEIRPVAYLRPNEGKRNIVIISNIEKMRTETANAFLKLLEEPGDRVIFLLTTDNISSLLPTIISRCQVISLAALSTTEIEQGLIEKDGLDPADAKYLARLSGGNYALTRFYDVDSLRSTRSEVINYLRSAFSQDAVKIIEQAEHWHADLNSQGQVAVLNMLEVFIRDLMVYRATWSENAVTNADQIDVIQKFVNSLGKARLEAIISEIDESRRVLYQNVQAKLVFIVLANRIAYLMRGMESPIPESESWRHIPSYLP